MTMTVKRCLSLIMVIISLVLSFKKSVWTKHSNAHFNNIAKSTLTSTNDLTKKPLHQVTNITSSDMSAKILKIPNRILAQGKRITWSSSDVNYKDNINISSNLVQYIDIKKSHVYEYISKHCHQQSHISSITPKKFTSLTIIHPMIEYQRYLMYDQLRGHLATLVKTSAKSSGQHISPSLMSFERWQFQSKLHDYDILAAADIVLKNKNSNQNTNHCTPTTSRKNKNVDRSSMLTSTIDPLLPHDRNYIDSGLLYDLHRSGVAKETAITINKKLMSESVKYVNLLINMSTQSNDKITNTSTTTTADVSFVSTSQSVRSNHSHTINATVTRAKTSVDSSSKGNIKIKILGDIVLIQNKHNCDLKLAPDTASLLSSTVLSPPSSSSSSSTKYTHTHTHTRSKPSTPYQDNNNLLFKINYEHISKLRSLWTYTRAHTHERQEGIIHEGSDDFAQVNSSNSSNSKEEVDEADDVTFYNDLYCLLVRYQALNGHGYQAAVSEHVFNTLKEYLHVSIECFASPLNCNLPLYCSLFPDTDAVFGSLGSFFDFQPKEGSFQANPPFIAEIMSKMVQHMHFLLGVYYIV